MNGVEKYAFAQTDINAVRSVTDLHQVTERIRRLGVRGYAPAVHVLAEIWRSCGVQPIRQAAGHALFAMGTSEAWRTLRDGVDDYEDLNRFLAFKTLFADGRSSWENLSPLFEPNRLAQRRKASRRSRRQGLAGSARRCAAGVPGDVELRLEQLNQISGFPVPPAMAAFWRIVGSLDLVPEYGKLPPGLPQELIKLDPLAVFSLSYAWPEVDEWRENAQEVHPEISGPIELPISADNLHKAGISGAGPYGIWFPCESADPLVRDEPHNLRFTDYLRRAFENKGFVLAFEPPFDPDAIAWIDNLAVELEPF